MSFVDFLKEYDEGKYVKRIQQTALFNKPFIVDFSDLYLFDPEYTMTLVNDPEKLLPEMETELTYEVRLVNPKRGSNIVKIRFINSTNKRTLRELDHTQLEKFIEVNGIVTQRTNPISKMVKSCYRCLQCGAQIFIDQESQFTMKPEKCPENTGRSNGCRNTKDFEIVPKLTEYKRVQSIKIQETPDQTPIGLLPKSIEVELEGDLCDVIQPGTRVVLLGWLKGRLFKKNDVNPVIDIYFYTNNAILKDNGDYSQEVTDEDIRRFHELVEREDFDDLLIRSTVPHLYGLKGIKKFMNLQQVGGVEKTIGEARKRGSIHGLLAGDPGEGKSDCLVWQSRLNTRGINVSGGGASGVGLTASVVKDPETSQWTLMAGAFVLADRGHVSVDEGEKMKNEDREHIHPAMEQQEININKAGINQPLPTRCSVLMAVNPDSGQWLEYQSFQENVSKIPIPLISRFDCIFILKNDREVEEEMVKADYILSLHRTESLGDVIDEDVLKKFYVYARQQKPVLTDEAESRLRELYKTLYSGSKQQNIIMITPRQLEGLIRLSEASAKLHLRDKVLLEDAEYAIDVMKASLLQSAIDSSTGSINIGKLYSGGDGAKERREALPRIVKQMSDENLDGDWVHEDDLRKYLMELWRIEELEATSLLHQAEKAKIIFYRGFRTDGQIQRG